MDILSFLINTVLFVTSFLLVLSFLVYFHELGHYSVGRFFNVAVERFSIGFGKPLIEWTNKNGTKWSIGRWPLGGYVKFLGDAGAASNPDEEQLAEIKRDMDVQHGGVTSDVFHFKPLWQRALIVLAGPMANFILAVIIFAGMAPIVDRYEIPSIVVSVVPGSGADDAGVLVGDHFISLNGVDVSDRLALQKYVALRSDVNMEAVVKRNDELVELSITPRKINEKDFIGGRSSRGQLGVGLNGPVSEKTHSPLSAVRFGVSEVQWTLQSTGYYLARVITGKDDLRQLGSVVKIATVTGKSAVDTMSETNVDANEQVKAVSTRLKELGMRLALLGASISIALGFANLMPIPALDGGHLLFYGYEAVAGKPLSHEKQELGFRIGFAVLITLFLVLTINDIGYVGSLFQ